MTDTPAAPGSPEPAVTVDDAALARVTAYEAAATPGVARLHPYALAAARQAVESAARRAGAAVAEALAGDGAGPAGTLRGGPAVDTDAVAVDVERDDATGVITLTVRVVASTDPPVLAAVREVQQRVTARVTELLGTPPVVAVRVMDVDLPA